MPAVLKIDPRRRVVFSSFYGRVTDEELLAQRSLIARDPDFNREFSEIADFTAVTDPDVTDQSLATMAASASIFSESVRHILVVRDGAIADLATKFKALSQRTRPNMFVVKTLAEAYELLTNGDSAKKRA